MSGKKFYFSVFFSYFLLISFNAQSQEVDGHVDMHVHLAAHLAYPYFYHGGPPHVRPPKEEVSYKHKYFQTLYQSYLKDTSTVLFVNAALDFHFGQSKATATKRVLEQFRYVEDFVKRYPNRYVLAKTPQEARLAIAQGKKVFVHAIEGASGLIQSKKDAQFWAQKGVSLITPIHLTDSEYGTAKLGKGWQSILNPKRFFKKYLFHRKDKGLTLKGRNLLSWLSDVGILTDVNHMSKKSLQDALKILKGKNSPAIATHAKSSNLGFAFGGLSDEEILTIYKTGGFIALTTGGHSGIQLKSKDQFQYYLGKNEKYCPGSIDDYIIQTKYMQDLLSSKFSTNYALGVSTDFNGMVDHFRPKYGPNGCEMKKAKVGNYSKKLQRFFNEFDIKGLNHVGQLRSMWEILAQSTLDMKVQLSSAEAFLQAWEKVRKNQDTNKNR